MLFPGQARFSIILPHPDPSFFGEDLLTGLAKELEQAQEML